ncbi:amino acid permease [Brucella endophytica]|uniref:Amino acid permease n=2 Tax=Brucella endophytica TaxID=1963359 RepID=A0A916SIA6_9HYPH|nr:APC family permease [Brucella endophytica]GGA98880.1 amino acid permease [Brucella endophytica]
MKREIGLIGLTFVAVSGVLGSGWLFAPLLASQQAGPASIVAWALGGIAILLIALTFAEISAMLPVPGGIARVPQFSHGNVVAMAMGWSAWIGYNSTVSVEVAAMLKYLAPHVNWMSGDLADWRTMAFAIALLALFTVINAIGVQFFARINSTLTWVKIAIPLVIIATLLISRFDTANFSQQAGGFSPYGLHGIFAAVSTGGIIFSYIGFRHAIDMAGEVKNPGRMIPLALILSVIICFLVYAGLQLAFVGAMPGSMLTNGWNGLMINARLGPIDAIATSLGLLWLVALLNVGAVIGPFGGGLVAAGSNARLAYALARNGFFPKFLAGLSKRDVPLPALILNFVLGAAILMIFSFDEIVRLNGASIVLSFIVGPIAVVALRQLLPDQRRPLRLPAVRLIGTIAFIVSTLIIYWSGWDTLWQLGLVLLLGLVLFVIHGRWLDPGPLDFREASWLIPYLVGIGLFSYFGTFGGKGDIPFGWDIVGITVFSLVIYAWAIACRLPKERCVEQINHIQSIIPDLEPKDSSLI